MDRLLSDTPHITFRIGAFQPLSVMKIMPKKIRSNGNRRPIRYENWNGAIGIRYHGKKVLENFIIILVDERFHTVKREAQNLHFIT